MRDVVVLLPGIMGSVLRKPRDGRDVWALSGGAILQGLRTLGGSVTSLRLAQDPTDVDDLGDGIVADRLIPDTHLIPGLWRIDGYSRIRDKILDTFDIQAGRNYFELAYDWRRDNRVAARQLASRSRVWLDQWAKSSGAQQPRLILVAHSMGGLVARYFIEVLGGWRHTRLLVTFGTPYSGSLNALNFLSNGLAVGLGGVNVLDLSSLLRSFTSIYQLLPRYRCYDPGNGQLVRVGETTGVPNVDSRRAEAALRFYQEIDASMKSNQSNPAYLKSDRYAVHPVVGIAQPTLQSARLVGQRLVFETRPLAGGLDGGDGTVPRGSAVPDATSERDPIFPIAERHGSLQNAYGVLDFVTTLLSGGSLSGETYKSPRKDETIAVEVQDVYSVAKPVTIRASWSQPTAPLVARVFNVGRNDYEEAVQRLTRTGPDAHIGEIKGLSEGTYRVTVEAHGKVNPVSDVFLVSRSD